jgi:hypothetical protein
MQNAAFSADGRTLLVACADNWIRVWETSTWGLRYRIQGAINLEVAPAGPWFATSEERDNSQQISVCDFRKWEALAPSIVPGETDKLWADLAAQDAARAFESIDHMVSNPKMALAQLDKRLSPVDSVKPSVIEEAIKNLDDARFEVRRAAKQRLTELGDVARDGLTRALDNNPSVEAGNQIKELLEKLDAPPEGERLRLLRAVEILEYIGSPDACRVLKRLGTGDAAASLTREAKAALDRLSAN